MKRALMWSVLERCKNKGEAGSGPLQDACCVGPRFNSAIRIVNLLTLFVIVRSDNEDMNIYLRSSKPAAAKGMWKKLWSVCVFLEGQWYYYRPFWVMETMG